MKLYRIATVGSIFFGLCGIIYAQNTETFSTYMNGLPSASTPLAGTEPMIVLQGGVAKQVPASSVGGGGGGGGNPGGTNQQVQYNNNGVFAGSPRLTDNGSIINASPITFTVGSDANGDVYFRNSTLSRLGIGTSGQVLSVNGATGLPFWNAFTVVATPAGLSGQFQYNSSGSFAGISTFTVSGTQVVAATPFQFSLGSDATGDVYYRNTDGNVIRLAIGASGQVLGVNGATNVPFWTTVSSGAGSPCASTPNAVQYNSAGSFGCITGTTATASGFALVATTGALRVGGSVAGSTIISSTVTNATGNIQVPAVTDTVATLGTADQLLSGGANVTSNSLGTKSSGTFTIDCGLAPLQFFTNGGGFTLAAPTKDGSCMLLQTNNNAAGHVTPSGFTVGSNTGGTLTTTSGQQFTWSIWRINGTAGYNIFAHQ